MAIKPLSILHLSQSDLEGGANRAAYRIHRAMCDAGGTSTFHSGRKKSDDPTVGIARPGLLNDRATDIAAYLNARALKRYPDFTGTPFSPVGLCYGRLDQALLEQCDVVIVHWVAGAFLHPSQLRRIKKPIIWRLSDIWPFSGGCHYPGDCRSYERSCGCCPQLGSDKPVDLSRKTFEAKQKAYDGLDITVAAPSHWIANCAKESALFGARRIECMPTGVDLTVFKPHDCQQARQSFGLPQEKNIVMFGAMSSTSDPRKGYVHLLRALEILSPEWADDTVIAVFGGRSANEPEMLAGFKVHHLGHIESELRLAELYSAADVLVAPFLEDNLPNVVLEALSCGTPVVAFAAGGIPDAIDSSINGMLAPIGDASVLAAGVNEILGNDDRRSVMRQASRRIAEERFDLARCTQRYFDLSAELAQDRAV